MRIKPGDHVVIPFDKPVSDADVARMKDHLRGAMPGVKWSVIDDTPMTHALVYEGADPASPDALAMAKRYESKLATALDLLDDIVARFNTTGRGVGGESVKYASADSERVSRWQQWVADAQRMS